jgi:DNA modification methylase
MIECLRSAKGATVLDPFIGSGTTLIACEEIGRTCYGVELDPRYVDVAVRRWQNLTGLQAKHAATGRTFDVAAKPKRKRKASKKKMAAK